MRGTVPEYEERQAAKWGGYTWADWCTLPRDERTHGVAHYRLEFVIEAHVHEATRRQARLSQIAQQHAARRASRPRGM